MIESKAWQRRRLWPLASDPAGKIFLWEGTTENEATGHFERQPGYEYRALYPQSAIDALQAENERLRALVIQYRDDLRHPPTGGSIERRLSAINQALEASHDQ